MIELRWTTKKYGLVLQYRYRTHLWVHGDNWSEWTDVLDVDGNYPQIATREQKPPEEHWPYDASTQESLRMKRAFEQK